MASAVFETLPAELVELIFIHVAVGGGAGVDGVGDGSGLAGLGAAVRVCRAWAALITEEDFAGWLMVLASLHRRCRLPLKLPWRRVIAADPDGRARRYRSMLRRVHADAVLLSAPAGRDHVVRVRLNRALASPKDHDSIYLKVQYSIPPPSQFGMSYCMSAFPLPSPTRAPRPAPHGLS